MNLNLDNFIYEEIENINNNTDLLFSISKLFIDVTSIPASILNSIYTSTNHIKNNDILSALNSLELVAVDLQKLTNAFSQSIEILKQEL